MKYQANINLSNKNNSHTLSFEKIYEHARGRSLKVLEVGCSTGYFGAALAGYGHEVWGVEPYQEAAAKAKLVLHSVYVGNIEDFFKNNRDVRFDAIIFGDVLEHLVDPASVLAQSIDFLNKGGIVVASIPNIAHIAIRAMMLEGRWEYSNLGILDRTHLRFFTRATIVDLFSDAGYKVLNVDAVRLSAEQVDELCDLNVRKESIKLAKDSAVDNRGYDFQYIVSASPGGISNSGGVENSAVKNESGVRVLCLVSNPDSSIVDIRLRTPLKRWVSKFSGSLRILSIYEGNSVDFSWADVVIFQREANEYIAGLSLYLQSCGKKVIFEIDDLLTNLPPFLSHHQAALNKSLQFINQMLTTADAVSVSSSELSVRYKRLNKRVYLTPNYSEVLTKSAAQYAVPPSEVTLIVASSDKVLVDMLIAPLLSLQSEFGVRVVGIGPPGERLLSFGVQVDQYDNLSHIDFKNFISSIDNGIGLIPLDDSEFSSCKTAIKYFDYSLSGVPSVCSNVLPYRDVVEDGVTGMLAENNTKAWIERLQSLIISDSLRSRIVAGAREQVVLRNNIDLAAESWQTLFDGLGVSAGRERIAVDGFSIGKRSYIAVFLIVFRHLASPTAYLQALRTVRRYGIRGLWEKLRVDTFN